MWQEGSSWRKKVASWKRSGIVRCNEFSISGGKYFTESLAPLTLFFGVFLFWGEGCLKCIVHVSWFFQSCNIHAFSNGWFNHQLEIFGDFSENFTNGYPKVAIFERRYLYH